jgi:hypothetical protein
MGPWCSYLPCQTSSLCLKRMHCHLPDAKATGIQKPSTEAKETVRTVSMPRMHTFPRRLYNPDLDTGADINTNACNCPAARAPGAQCP